MPGDESDDERAGGPRPDPHDRVWFHPSEMQSFEAVAARAPDRADRRGTWLALAALSVIALMVGILGATDALDPGGGPGPATPQAQAAFGRDEISRILTATGPGVVAVLAVQATGATTRASGICIGTDQVLTSAHVLDGGAPVMVVTPEGEQPALPVGVDYDTHLTLLRIGAPMLSPLDVGPTDRLRLGDPVLAVAADDDDHWQSVGVIGAVDQLAATAYTVVAGLFDTETGAADEHSGGVVLDESGAVVGVLTIPPGSGPSGLALPIEVALAVGTQLETEGRARHGWLGVSGSDASDRAAGGARVKDVLAGSPAEAAGLGSGDLIIEVGEDGSKTPVANMSALMAEVRARPPGASMEITVLRGGEKVAMVAELGEKEPPTAPTSPAPEPTEPVGAATP